MKIRSQKDFWSGLMFIGSGLFFALWAMAFYQMGTAVRMGPAYFPTMLGFLLTVLGAAVLLQSLAMEPEGDQAVHTPFNIIDLLIVVAILAILAAILIPNFLRARASSQLATCQLDNGDMRSALALTASSVTVLPQSREPLSAARAVGEGGRMPSRSCSSPRRPSPTAT